MEMVHITPQGKPGTFLPGKKKLKLAGQVDMTATRYQTGLWIPNESFLIPGLIPWPHLNQTYVYILGLKTSTDEESA